MIKKINDSISGIFVEILYTAILLALSLGLSFIVYIGGF